jgi:tRNA(fMet)-specific endonuclease VapC
MVLLDTDHMSLLERGGAECRRIQARLREVPPDDVATTVVSYEEQMRGWLSRIAETASPERQISIYAELKRQLRNYCDIAVVDYDSRAALVFARLKSERVRIGTMDLKIAAIALANDATLLSRNLADFAKVAGLNVKDWSSI